MPDPKILLREAVDADSSRLVQLISGVFAEYEGCVLDVEREEPDLLAIATAFAAKPGKIWVAEARGVLVGCLGVVQGDSRAELKKLYVAKTHRRHGLASELFALALAQAHAWRAKCLVAWSDSRFHEAHHFYERLGFRRMPGSRALHDLSATIEYPFEMSLAPANPADRMRHS